MKYEKNMKNEFKSISLFYRSFTFKNFNLISLFHLPQNLAKTLTPNFKQASSYWHVNFYMNKHQIFPSLDIFHYLSKRYSAKYVMSCLVGK